MATSHSSITSTSTLSQGGTSPDPTPCTSKPPVAILRKRRPRCIYRPAKHSLYDILHMYAGTSLFVRPERWIDLHAQLRGTRWKELPPCDTPHPVFSPGDPPCQGYLNPSKTISTLSNNLTQIHHPDSIDPILTSNAVKSVLETLWPETFSKPQGLSKFRLYFGGRVYRDAVRAQLTWNFPSDEAKSSYSSFKSTSTRPAETFDISAQSSPIASPVSLPMICYINKSQLAAARTKLVRVAPGPGGSFNEPVLRLQQLRARLLAPSNSNHDAYFVGIFLGMAQRHFYPWLPATGRRDTRMSSKQGIPPSPNFQDVKLRILTHDTDTSEFIVYTAYITKEFLEKFHDPFKAPPGDDDVAVSGLKIDYTRVPIWPILGLRERLGKAFGEDVVGRFDSDKMETWETDPEGSGDRKRKREALPEVTTSSSGADSDDELALVNKKRC